MYGWFLLGCVHACVRPSSEFRPRSGLRWPLRDVVARDALRMADMLCHGSLALSPSIGVSAPCSLCNP